MSESLIAGCSRYGPAVGIGRAGSPGAFRNLWPCGFAHPPAGNRHTAAPTHRLSAQDDRARMPVVKHSSRSGTPARRQGRTLR